MGKGLSRAELSCTLSPSLQSPGVRARPPGVFLRRYGLHPPETGQRREASDSKQGHHVGQVVSGIDRWGGE